MTSNYNMIALFSPSMKSASIRGGTWISILALIAFIIVHLIPPKILTIAASGPNARTLLLRIPLVGSIGDWCESSYAALPLFLRIALEATVGSLVHVVTATITPTAFMTWASLSAFMVLIASSYWIVFSASGNFIMHASIISVISILLLYAAVLYLPTYMSILAGGTGSSRYLGCAVFASFFSAIFMTIAPSSALAHVEVLSISA